ncbi:MAG: glycoside hydrolase family 127 protein [Bacteroidales bacterium]|nr:glycoside hydrolase family 127 protein [Bacteroidales bacterium]
MNKFTSILVIVAVLYSCKQKQSLSADYPVVPVPFTNVKLTDQFWLPRLDTNRIVSIPYNFQKCEETHRIDNFRVAGGLKQGSFVGIRYNDSDVFKVMEGAAYSLSTYPDPKVEAYMDELIAAIAAAQEEDGYLYTARTIDPDTIIPYTGEERWSFLQQSHELYNIGHMYEAAVAYYEATGKRSFLDVAIKSADLVVKVFGTGAGQLRGVPGHQEIEIGLVKLYRVTGNKKYLDQAKYFLDDRGNAQARELYVYGKDGSNKTYTQDHQPVIQQFEAVGHAVRAGYMYSGMTDIAAFTGDKAYRNAIEKLWENVALKKMYITGGIGARHSGEAFGDDYELPNLSAYNETCAAIANMLWNQRMFLLSGDSKYVDVLERTLYNGFLSGVSIHGDRFFYPNPLESDGSHERQPWFDCSCCPTNVARFMPSLPGYIYAHTDKEVFVNLFIGSEGAVKMGFGDLKLIQQTNYPWDGEVKIEVNPSSNAEFTMAVRIPVWSVSSPMPGDLYQFRSLPAEKPVISINGEVLSYAIKDGYAQISRIWQQGDQIELNIPMPVTKIVSKPEVKENTGRMAISRGPLIYCAEWVDNGGRVRNLLVDPELEFQVEQTNLVNGVSILKSNAYHVSKDSNDDQLIKTDRELVLIPYYAWAHRGNGEMLVWLPYEESAANPTPPPTIASEAKQSASYIYDQISALNDQLIPKNSNDHTIPRFTFWSHKGTKEWVEYEFNQETSIAYIHVYWFDDGPDGGCRIPQSWKAFYLDNGNWKEVFKHGQYPVLKDQMNTIEISQVKTTAMRLEIQLQPDYSGGILEWKVE